MTTTLLSELVCVDMQFIRTCDHESYSRKLKLPAKLADQSVVMSECPIDGEPMVIFTTPEWLFSA